jgi:MYXO-CTERM domain-containing protein
LSSRPCDRPGSSVDQSCDGEAERSGLDAARLKLINRYEELTRPAPGTVEAQSTGAISGSFSEASGTGETVVVKEAAIETQPSPVDDKVPTNGAVHGGCSAAPGSAAAAGLLVVLGAWARRRKELRR